MAEYQVNDKSIIPGAPVFHFLKTERNRHGRYNNPQPAQ
jgi:hypothetical protein